MTTLQEKIAVMQHFADGGEIEITRGDSWISAAIPTWDWYHYDYRIAITKPSINWDHVSEKYNYLAVNENGQSYLYGDKPSVGSSAWRYNGGNFMIAADSHASFKPGTCDWKDSLISRFDG